MTNTENKPVRVNGNGIDTKLPDICWIRKHCVLRDKCETYRTEMLCDGKGVVYERRNCRTKSCESYLPFMGC